LAHYHTAITTLRERGDDAGAAQAEVKLADIQDAIDGITRRAATLLIGWVALICDESEDHSTA
jgi:hypothetical protein